MSLHDKYFSSKNKQHIYSLLGDIILKEAGQDIQGNSLFSELYTFQYPKIFDEFTGDNLIDLNKSLLDTVGNSIIRTIRKKYGEQKIEIDPIKRPTVAEEDPRDAEDFLNIYSSDRESSSINRYDYTVSVDERILKLQSVTLPEESNSLFSLPTIQIRLSSQTREIVCICQLDDTKELGTRIYHTFVPQIQIGFPVKDTLRIQVLNHLGHHPIKDTDIIQINQSKEIQFSGKSVTCFGIEEIHDVSPSDTLGIFVDSELMHESRIRGIHGPYVLCDSLSLDQKDLKDQKDLTALNLSLQNHLSFIHSTYRDPE